MLFLKKDFLLVAFQRCEEMKKKTVVVVQGFCFHVMENGNKMLKKEKRLEICRVATSPQNVALISMTVSEKTCFTDDDGLTPAELHRAKNRLQSKSLAPPPHTHNNNTVIILHGSSVIII